jgi:pilus assembly protein Flp/PilA
MTNLIARFANDESGATAIEYGLLAAIISVSIVGVLGSVSDQLDTTFQSVADGMVSGN